MCVRVYIKQGVDQGIHTCETGYNEGIHLKEDLNLQVLPVFVQVSMIFSCASH